jgi:hypothetical protein
LQTSFIGRDSKQDAGFENQTSLKRQMKKFQFVMNGAGSPQFPLHAYEVRPRKDKPGFDLISDVLQS